MVYPNEFKWCKTDIPCSMDYDCEKCKFYNANSSEDPVTSIIKKWVFGIYSESEE